MNRTSRRAAQDRWDRRLAVVAVATIIAAWVVGSFLNGREGPDCRSVLPSAQICRSVGQGIEEGVVVNNDHTETVIGWAKTGAASGYAGKVTALVGITPDGTVEGVSIISQTETPVYFKRVLGVGYVDDLVGRRADSPFELGVDLDGVTSATYSSRAIAGAVRSASHSLASEELGLELEAPRQSVKFGLPEIVLVALYLTGLFGHRGGVRYKKAIRWAMMLAGMLVLGFIYNEPLTIANFNSLLLGFWPSWQQHIYWYLLLGGVLFVMTVDNKNPYCTWFCPFGAAQECLGAMGGARLWSPGNHRFAFKWAQRFLAWSAIILGLLTRNPGLSSYEIFGTLFSFNGVATQWIILVIILLLSLFVRRPWCEFLCPIAPVMDFIHAIRRWVRQEKMRIWRGRQVSIEGS
jgi:NosR/NirI family nitrous oxide reductase transcriptional regulator